MVKPEGADKQRGDAAYSVVPARTRATDRGNQQPTNPRVLVAFALAGISVSVFYVLWFAMAYDERMWPTIWVSAATALVYGSGLIFAATRFTTAGAILVVTLAAVSVALYAAVLSTHSDVHMLYLAIGFAMLALFPEHLFKLRVTYVGGILVLVVACEFLFSTSNSPAWSEPARDHYLASANRLWTVAVIAMAMAIVLFRSVRRQRDLSGAAELGEYRANTDPMTGINNRRPVQVRLRELDVAIADGYAIALIDIDSFKSINDLFGHEEGDVLISAIAGRLRTHFRQTDVVSRWGGDEFLVLLTCVEPEELRAALERLRASIADSPFLLGSSSINVTLSIGVAIAGPGGSSQRTMNSADQALYMAKHTGRDRVVMADDAELRVTDYS